jgi:hypothetical protein
MHKKQFKTLTKGCVLCMFLPNISLNAPLTFDPQLSLNEVTGVAF